MILSIVVPAYNVEKYIERCLDSIVNQSSHSADYEVIIINDGSTDNTLDVIKQYEKNYSQIILINQPNQGLSVARNNGMKEAKGDYVWFVDSDDWINEDAIYEIRNAASSHPDVIALNYTSCGENLLSSGSTSFSSKQLSCIDGISLLKEDFKIQAQFYIYNRSFLNKHILCFYPGIYHEDMEFTPRMLFFAETISFINKPLYNFYKRSNSITTTVNPKRSYDYIQVADNLISFVNLHNSDVNRSFYKIISRAVCNAMRIAGECKIEESKKFINFFTIDMQRKYSAYFLKTRQWNYVIIGISFLLLPCYSVKVYNNLFKQ